MTARGLRARHGYRAHLIDSVAILSGYSRRFVLPDGARPDVLRINVASGSVFIGDAKDSERPTDRAAAARLSAYLWWLMRPAMGRGCDFLAICHPGAHAAGWRATISALLDGAGLVYGAPRSVAVAMDASVSWATVHGLADGHNAATTHAVQRG